jgi:DNA repair protein RadC
LLLRSTEAIIDIAAPLDIYVHDHIIVGRAGHASLKGMKLNQS